MAPLDGRMMDLVKREFIRDLWRECFFSSIIMPVTSVDMFEGIIACTRGDRIV